MSSLRILPARQLEWREPRALFERELPGVEELAPQELRARDERERLYVWDERAAIWLRCFPRVLAEFSPARERAAS